MRQYKATPSTKQPIKASSQLDGRPEGATYAGRAADDIEILFEMNSRDEVPLSEYLTTEEADTLSKAFFILREFERAYTVDVRGW